MALQPDTRATTTLLVCLPPAYAISLLFLGPGNNLALLFPITALLFIAGGYLVWRDLREQRVTLPVKGMPLLMALYLVWLLASPWWSTWFQVSWYNALTLASLPIVFLVWVYQPDPEGLWRRLWPLLLLTTALVGIWGLGQYAFTQHRSNGPFLDYNSFGAVFVLFLLPALFRYLTLSQAPRGRFWQLRALEAFIVIAAGALFATYSRGAVGTFLIVLVPAVLLARRHYRRFAVPLLIFVVLVGATFAAVKTYPSKPIDRNLDLEKDPSFQSRLMMWRSAWNIYKTHPLLGTGLGTFKLYYHSYRNPHETESSGDLAHDDYIEFLQEGGPIQLGFLLATGLCVLLVGWRLYRRIPTRHDPRAPPGGNDHHPAEAFGLLLGLVAIFGQTVVNFIFYIMPLSIIAGLWLARAYRLTREPPLETFAIPVRPPVSGLALWVILGLPLVGLGLDGASAMVLSGQSGLNVVRHIDRNGLSQYKFAVAISALRPDSIIPWTSLAEMDQAMAAKAKRPAQRRKLVRQARDDYLHLLRIVRVNPFALHGLATLIERYPAARKGLPKRYHRPPERLLVEAIKQDPQYVKAYMSLARELEKKGDENDALAVLAGYFNTWLYVPGSTRAANLRLLHQALALAQRLHRDQAVDAIASTILSNQPGNRAALDALARVGGHARNSGAASASAAGRH